MLREERKIRIVFIARLCFLKGAFFPLVGHDPPDPSLPCPRVPSQEKKGSFRKDPDYYFFFFCCFFAWNGSVF